MRGNVALVAGAFAAVMIVPQLLQSFLPQPVKSAVVALTARVSAGLIALAGMPATQTGDSICLTNHIFRIDLACSGLQWLSLFTVTVLFVPVTWMRKRQALLIGLPVLVAFNLARIVMVALVSERWPAHFVWVHDLVMQSAFIVVTFGVWLAWMWVARDDWKPGWV